MEGDITSAEHMGVIPRSVHAIFNYLEGISADYTVRTSFLELYNEVRGIRSRVVLAIIGDVVHVVWKKRLVPHCCCCAYA